MAAKQVRKRWWIDRAALEAQLDSFFEQSHQDIDRFGSTINQIFEVYVYTQVLRWYRTREWRVTLVHPTTGAASKTASGAASPSPLKLKRSTAGPPKNYTYAKCEKPAATTLQVRHQLRVQTRSGERMRMPRANVVLDVAVIQDCDLSSFSTWDSAPNSALITFGEAKHMSAHAELVANFRGLATELQPERARKHTPQSLRDRQHPAPFLFVSGLFQTSAQALLDTIRRRGFDLEFRSRDEPLDPAAPLPLQVPVRRARKPKVARPV